MLRGNLTRNEDEGDERAAAKYALQIEASVLLQPFPSRDAILDLGIAAMIVAAVLIGLWVV